jgi:hypothetical protein
MITMSAVMSPNGQNWMLLGNPEGYREVLSHALLLNGQDIYCEVFPEPGTVGLNANKAVAKWNGSAWSILGITSSIGGSGLHALAFAHGELYGSGALYDPTNPQQGLNLGRLVTPNWLPVGGGVNADLSMFDIASDGTNLLIQGSFTISPGILLALVPHPATGSLSGTRVLRRLSTARSPMGRWPCRGPGIFKVRPWNPPNR